MVFHHQPKPSGLIEPGIRFDPELCKSAALEALTGIDSTRIFEEQGVRDAGSSIDSRAKQVTLRLNELGPSFGQNYPQIIKLTQHLLTGNPGANRLTLNVIEAGGETPIHIDEHPGKVTSATLLGHGLFQEVIPAKPPLVVYEREVFAGDSFSIENPRRSIKRAWHRVPNLGSGTRVSASLSYVNVHSHPDTHIVEHAERAVTLPAAKEWTVHI